jgi:ATP-binding cassette subfamily B protein
VQSATSGLLTSLGQLYEHTLYLRNLFEFLDVAPLERRSGSRPFPSELRLGIEFRHVSFRYPGTERLILSDVSFHCPAGSCVALVGRNGAGKTTIVKLLTRLYEPSAGQILIDGVPIEEYNLDDLRKHIGTIFQDFVQYELPVADNIGFGNLEERGNRSSLEQAARASGAAAFVERLEHGYETRLGRLFEKGEQLSVGQWQKIALARAFIGQAPIVVLDEPTASIDAEAEAEIFGTLRLAARGATTLLIAHRFSTVRMADRILVLEQGRLHEEGTHEALMRAQGLYARLFSLQAAGYLGE